MKHRTPKFLYSRIKQLIFQKVNPDKPWLTPQSILLLDQLIRRTDVGLEFGSGRSTLWFAKRCAHLTSVEHSESWYKMLSDQLKNVSNCTYLCKPILGRQSPDEEDYFKVTREFSRNSLDFILVDGKVRDVICISSVDLLKPGGLLILDNAERYIPNNFGLPESNVINDAVKKERWRQFLGMTNSWRSVWTEDGVSSTLVFFKP